MKLSSRGMDSLAIPFTYDSITKNFVSPPSRPLPPGIARHHPILLSTFISFKLTQILLLFFFFKKRKRFPLFFQSIFNEKSQIHFTRKKRNCPPTKRKCLREAFIGIKNNCYYFSLYPSLNSFIFPVIKNKRKKKSNNAKREMTNLDNLSSSRVIKFA